MNANRASYKATVLVDPHGSGSIIPFASLYILHPTTVTTALPALTQKVARATFPPPQPYPKGAHK